MPYYSFSNPNNPAEIIDVFFHMNDDKKYIKDDIEWERVWSKPQAAIDTKCDPFSAQDFSAKTGKKKGTWGDITDYSKEMGEKRKDKEGVDLVREKYYDDYKKKYGGKKTHIDVKRRNVKEKLGKLGYELE